MWSYLKKLRFPLVLLATAILSACQPGWVRLDGNSPQQSELQQAQVECRVAEKRAQLEATGDPGSQSSAAINDNEARMLRLETYDSAKRRVNEEIETCMRQQGLRPDS